MLCRHAYIRARMPKARRSGDPPEQSARIMSPGCFLNVPRPTRTTGGRNRKRRTSFLALQLRIALRAFRAAVTSVSTSFSQRKLSVSLQRWMFRGTVFYVGRRGIRASVEYLRQFSEFGLGRRTGGRPDLYCSAFLFARADTARLVNRVGETRAR